MIAKNINGINGKVESRVLVNTRCHICTLSVFTPSTQPAKLHWHSQMDENWQKRITSITHAWMYLCTSPIGDPKHP